jgi:hypothetical protein
MLIPLLLRLHCRLRVVSTELRSFPTAATNSLKSGAIGVDTGYGNNAENNSQEKDDYRSMFHKTRLLPFGAER